MLDKAELLEKATVVLKMALRNRERRVGSWFLLLKLTHCQVREQQKRNKPIVTSSQ